MTSSTELLLRNPTKTATLYGHAKSSLIQNATGGMTPSRTRVAWQMLVSHSVIHRLSLRFAKINSVADQPRIGRPVCTTPAEGHYLRTCGLRSVVHSCKPVFFNLTDTSLSTQTVRNRLQSAGLRARQPYEGIMWA